MRYVPDVLPPCSSCDGVDGLWVASMTYCICSCGVVCEGPEGPVVEMLRHWADVHGGRPEAKIFSAEHGYIAAMKSARAATRAQEEMLMRFRKLVESHGEVA